MRWLNIAAVFAIANAISIGLVGPSIIVHNKEFDAADLMMANVYTHTLPSYVALFLYATFRRDLKNVRSPYPQVALLIFDAIYSLTPHDGAILFEKVRVVYGVDTPVLWCAYLFVIQMVTTYMLCDRNNV